MRENYALSLKLVLVHEGGFVNDPQDPGGATNKGITQKTYDAWRLGEGLPKRSVVNLNFWETTEIYRNGYWNKIEGDELPKGVDYCVFDFCVNSGIDRASKYLQRVVGVADDGRIGPQTLSALGMYSSKQVIDNLCDMRQAFLERQPTFAHFGKGWTTRVAEVRAKAKEMADG